MAGTFHEKANLDAKFLTFFNVDQFYADNPARFAYFFDELIIETCHPQKFLLNKNFSLNTNYKLLIKN
jgi:DNA mismatch repair ATPase MutL